jgi:hypothetical protein
MADHSSGKWEDVLSKTDIGPRESLEQAIAQHYISSLSNLLSRLGADKDGSAPSFRLLG